MPDVENEPQCLCDHGMSEVCRIHTLNEINPAIYKELARIKQRIEEREQNSDIS